MNAYKDKGISFTYAPDGESYFGKLDLYEATNVGKRGGHSVCSHPHRTSNAALSCARKKRADFRAGRIGVLRK